MVYVDYVALRDCINSDSYGMICVGCGCCSRNPDYRDMIICRIRYYKQQLNESQYFDDWEEDERWRKLQEKNVKSNILYYKQNEYLRKDIMLWISKVKSIASLFDDPELRKVYGA